MRKIKQGTAFNVARQYFMIDSLNDLPALENAYSCAQGDIAELPSGDIYVKAEDSALGWKLQGEAGSGSSSSVILQNREVNITSNGTTVITPSTGYDALESVQINTAVNPPVLQSKEVQLTVNGTTNISADNGYDGLNTVEVEVSVPPPTFQAKNCNIITNTTTTVLPDNGYDGLSGVTITTQVGRAEEKAVNFIDYDGTILYSYTAAEFANLTELPQNPSHNGLIAQGWNWTLENAKTYVAAYGKLWIGQLYITSSGKTEIDISLTNEDLLSPYLYLNVNGQVIIDWGDNSSTDTITGSSGLYYQQHIYSTIGDYTISIEVITGTFIFTAGLLGSTNDPNTGIDGRYAISVTAIRCGNNMPEIGRLSTLRNLETITIPQTVDAILTYSFENCLKLKAIVIPNATTEIRDFSFRSCQGLKRVSFPLTITSIGEYAFASCTSLQKITLSSSTTTILGFAFSGCTTLQEIILPNSIISIGEGAFSSCTSIQTINIPNNLTTISTNLFYATRSLQKITIPQNITEIQGYAFGLCSSLSKVVFEPTTPPTVSSISAFLSLDTGCIFVVPDGTLENYTSATNYPDATTYTYIEE